MKPGNSTSDKSNESVMQLWQKRLEPIRHFLYTRSSTQIVPYGYLSSHENYSIASSSTPLTEWERTALEMRLAEIRGLSISTTIPTLLQCPSCSRPFPNSSELEKHSTTCIYGVTSTASTSSDPYAKPPGTGLTEPLSSISKEKAAESRGRSMDLDGVMSLCSMLSRERNQLLQSIEMFSSRLWKEIQKDTGQLNPSSHMLTSLNALATLEILYSTALLELGRLLPPPINSNSAQQQWNATPPTTGNAYGGLRS